MDVKPYDIFNVKLPYRNSNDIRPVVVIELIPNGSITVALISGAMDLMQGSNIHFRISTSSPNFKDTGLKKECYIAGDQIFIIPKNLLIKKRGKLAGDLAVNFSKWI